MKCFGCSSLCILICVYVADPEVDALLEAEEAAVVDVAGGSSSTSNGAAGASTRRPTDDDGRNSYSTFH